MNEPGILGLIAPLVLAVTEPDDMLTLLADLGVPIDSAPDDPIDDLRALLPIDAVEDIVDVIQPYLDGSADGSLPASDVATIVESVTEILSAITELAGATTASIASMLPAWLDAETLLDAVALLPGYLIRRWFDDVSEPIGATVDLAGLTTPIPVSGVPMVDATSIGSLLGDPSAHLHDEYVVDGEILASLLVDRLVALGRALGLGAVAGDEDQSGVLMLPPGDRSAGALQVILSAEPNALLATVAVSGIPRLDVDLGNGWSVTSASDFAALAGAAMRLDAAGLHDASSTSTSSTLELAVDYRPPDPAILFGTSPGSRLDTRQCVRHDRCDVRPHPCRLAEPRLPGRRWTFARHRGRRSRFIPRCAALERRAGAAVPARRRGGLDGWPPGGDGCGADDQSPAGPADRPGDD